MMHSIVSPLRIAELSVLSTTEALPSPRAYPSVLFYIRDLLVGKSMRSLLSAMYIPKIQLQHLFIVVKSGSFGSPGLRIKLALAAIATGDSPLLKTWTAW